MVPTATAMMAITMTTAATMMAVFVAFALFIAMIVPATTTSAAAFATDMV